MALSATPSYRIVRTTYDNAGQVTQVRTTYRSDGLPTKVEQGIVDSQSDSDWTNFASVEEAQTDYDSNDRPTVQRLLASGTTYALTQTSYDGLGRVDCVAQRMNPDEFGSLSGACSLDVAGSYGPDRITRSFYDAPGQPGMTATALGTADEAWAYVLRTANGHVQYLVDTRNNSTAYQYDGHDRLIVTYYPKADGSGVNWFDNEALTYDAAGNVTSRRLRDNGTLAYQYDALNRLTLKDLPGTSADVWYGYDHLGRMIAAAFTASWTGVTFGHDALGRTVSTENGIGGFNRALHYAHDDAGNRIRLYHPDEDGDQVPDFYLVENRDELGRLTLLQQGDGASVAQLIYAPDGARQALWRPGGTTSYGHDGLGRLTGLGHDLAGAGDVAWTFAYNPPPGLDDETQATAISWPGLRRRPVRTSGAIAWCPTMFTSSSCPPTLTG